MRIGLLFAILFGLSSCLNLDAPTPVQDNEVISRVTLIFTEKTENEESESEDELSFSCIDSNGDGVVDQTDSIELDRSKEYEVEIEFWNEFKNPAVNITQEVEDAAEYHLVKLKIAPNGFITTTTLDKDNNNMELGLKQHLRPNATGKATLNVVLYHQPPVNGSPLKDGFSEVGSTDVDVEFNVLVK